MTHDDTSWTVRQRGLARWAMPVLWAVLVWMASLVILLETTSVHQLGPVPLVAGWLGVFTGVFILLMGLLASTQAVRLDVSGDWLLVRGRVLRTPPRAGLFIPILHAGQLARRVDLRLPLRGMRAELLPSWPMMGRLGPLSLRTLSSEFIATIRHEPNSRACWR